MTIHGRKILVKGHDLRPTCNLRFATGPSKSLVPRMRRKIWHFQPIQGIALSKHRWLGILGLWISILGLTIECRSTRGLESVPTMVGAKECAACHSAPSPIYQSLGVTSFLELREAKKWLENDKHSYAYDLVRHDLHRDGQIIPREKLPISNQLSMAICDRMGWNRGTWDGIRKAWQGGDGNFERHCLTCHAGVPSGIAPQAIDRHNLNFGVHCEACHGPGSVYTLRENHQQPNWRTLTSDEKASKGLVDLHSPSVAAKVCFSCHIGDLEQNRFITHDMYRAGHPPLPPVDLQIFIAAMPPHWRELKEKPLPIRDGEKPPPSFEFQSEYYLARSIPSAEQGSLEVKKVLDQDYAQTRRSMVGLLAVNDIGEKMILDAALMDNRWGDLALYDCTGCHHQLSASNPRFRDPGQTPGRPYPASWMAADYAWLDAEKPSSIFSRQVILAAFEKVPFGEAQAIREVRTAHLNELDARLKQRQSVEQKFTTKKEAQVWLASVFSARSPRLGDYWTARQTGWFFEVAIREMISHREIPVNSQTEIEENLRQLSDELSLNLAIPREQATLEILPKTLEQAKKHRPAETKRLLTKLLELVGQ